jgi:hypothetical protein
MVWNLLLPVSGRWIQAEFDTIGSTRDADARMSLSVAVFRDNKMRYFILILFPLFLLTLATQLWADVYKYRDAQGRLHFTDAPMEKSSGYRLVWQKQRIEPQVVAHEGLRGRATARQKKPEAGVSAFKGSWMSDAARENRDLYGKMIDEAARKVKLRPELLHAVVMAESRYDPNAESDAGAQGLMQLMPATAERYGVSNRLDPRQNVKGGSRYLRDLLKMFRFNLNLALAGYNAGENAVIRHGNKIPPYDETQGYVRKVLGYYQENRIRSAIAGQTAGR